jgi:hypothetical protein
MGGFLRQMMLVWSSLLPHNLYLQYMFIPLPCFSVFYISSKLLLHVIYISSVLSRILYLLSASPQSVFFPCFFMFIPLPCFSVFYISSQLLLHVIYISSVLSRILFPFRIFSLLLHVHTSSMFLRVFFISSQLLLLVIFISSLLLHFFISSMLSHFLSLFPPSSKYIYLTCFIMIYISSMLPYVLYLLTASPCICIYSIYLYLVCLPMFYVFSLLL